MNQIQTLREELSQLKTELTTLAAQMNRPILDPIRSNQLVQWKLIELIGKVKKMENELQEESTPPTASSIKKLPESRMDDSWYQTSSLPQLSNSDIDDIIQSAVNRNNSL